MKQSSTASLITLGILFGLMILVSIPNFVKRRVTGSQDLIFSLHVVDAERKPIPGAHACSGMTDSSGNVSLKKAFMASGRGQLTHCRLDSSVRIEASGYKPWESDLESLFGARYDYSRHGTTLNQTLTVPGAKEAQPRGSFERSAPRIRSTTEGVRARSLGPGAAFARA